MVFRGNPEDGSGANARLLQTTGNLYGGERLQNRKMRARKQAGLLAGDDGHRAGCEVLHPFRTRSERLLLPGKYCAKLVQMRFVRAGALPGKCRNGIQ